MLCLALVLGSYMLTSCDKDAADETDADGNYKTLEGKTPEEIYVNIKQILEKTTNFTMET